MKAVDRDVKITLGEPSKDLFVKILKKCAKDMKDDLEDDDTISSFILQYSEIHQGYQIDVHVNRNDAVEKEGEHGK